MSKSKKQRDPIPESFASIEEAAEFWDSHSTADYDDLMRDVHFEVDIQRRTFLVPIEGGVAKEIVAIANQQELGLETFVNLWLREKLTEVAGNQLREG
ncbi:MAG: CopG family antitoxin [bacterium]|nr:CopG family antitoxin [bacterium]